MLNSNDKETHSDAKYPMKCELESILVNQQQTNKTMVRVHSLVFVCRIECETVLHFFSTGTRLHSSVVQSKYVVIVSRTHTSFQVPYKWSTSRIHYTTLHIHQHKCTHWRSYSNPLDIIKFYRHLTHNFQYRTYSIIWLIDYILRCNYGICMQHTHTHYTLQCATSSLAAVCISIVSHRIVDNKQVKMMMMNTTTLTG